MSKTPSEGKIFNLKPEMTVAMKLAAAFAITYYGLLFVFEIITVVYRRYYIDSYYFNEGQAAEGTSEFVIQIVQLALSAILVFSLIQIFRKKNHGKALFVGASLVLIIFQLLVTGMMPWLKYALEVLLVLLIAPIRVKKKVKTKQEKKEPETTEVSEVKKQDVVTEASSQPVEQP